MKTKLKLSLVALVTLALGAANLQAQNVSGVFADKGTVIGKDGATISFHGLLSLDFNPVMTDAKYSDTSHVAMFERDGKIDIEIFNDDEEMIWGAVWDASDGYSREGDVAVIRMQSTKSTRVALSIRPISGGDILEVTANYISPTAFGPNAEPIGTYIFVKSE
ncbi:MAG: hypothetical protein SynsKO_35410 [Synoicihabitans sp.]